MKDSTTLIGRNSSLELKGKFDIDKAWRNILGEIRTRGFLIQSRNNTYFEILDAIVAMEPGLQPDSTKIELFEVLKKKVFPELIKISDIISEDPGTRRAFLYFPEMIEGDPPCNLIYHFLLRNTYLIMNVYIRSADIYNKFFSDIHSALVCQEELCRLLGDSGRPGNITFFIGSAHIRKEDLARSRLLDKRV